MAGTPRSTAIDRIGDVATWGTHVDLFYETKDDLLDTVVPYCKTGLERRESSLWFVAEPYLTTEEAWHALKDGVDGLGRHGADASVAQDWFLRGGATFDFERVAAAWYEKIASVSARGDAGLRVTGDAGWVDKKEWNVLIKWEDRLNEVVRNQPVAVVCSYPLAACGAPRSWTRCGHTSLPS